MSDAPEEEKRGQGGLCSCWTVGIAGVLILVVAAIAIPNLIEARKYPPATAAIGALKTITTSETLFREGDKENDGNLDYGMLSELSATQLIDTVLGSGTKQAYLFEAAYSPTTSEFLWFATAHPTPRLLADEPDSRRFFVNHAGVIWYSVSPAPLVFDRGTCEISTTVPGIHPIGR